jgi:hypothetical protein
MRRALHIVIAAMAVILLLRPLECFGMTVEAANCCIKGTCLPTATSDDCCKGGAVPYGSQVLQTDTKDTSHWLPVILSVSPVADGSILSLSRGEPLLVIHAPPGLPPDSRLNLPLLI